MKWYEDPVYRKMCEKAVKVQEYWKREGAGWSLIPCFVFDTTMDRVAQVLYCPKSLRKLMPSQESETIVLSVERDNDGNILIPGNKAKAPSEDCIWLPSQSQLQGLYGFGKCNYSGELRMLKSFCDFCDKYIIPKRPFGSMEQLWLAFVMKEKFNKTWNGENWEESK